MKKFQANRAIPHHHTHARKFPKLPKRTGSQMAGPEATPTALRAKSFKSAGSGKSGEEAPQEGTKADMSFQCSVTRSSYSGTCAPYRDTAVYRRDSQNGNYGGHQFTPTVNYRASSYTAESRASVDFGRESLEKSRTPTYSKVPVSKTRQKIRSIICRSRNDPNYFDP